MKIKKSMITAVISLLSIMFLIICFSDRTDDKISENITSKVEDTKYSLVFFDDKKNVVSVLDGKTIKEVDSENEDLVSFEIDGKTMLTSKDTDYQIIIRK